MRVRAWMVALAVLGGCRGSSEAPDRPAPPPPPPAPAADLCAHALLTGCEVEAGRVTARVAAGPLQGATVAGDVVGRSFEVEWTGRWVPFAGGPTALAGLGFERASGTLGLTPRDDLEGTIVAEVAAGTLGSEAVGWTLDQLQATATATASGEWQVGLATRARLTLPGLAPVTIELAGAVAADSLELAGTLPGKTAGLPLAGPVQVQVAIGLEDGAAAGLTLVGDLEPRGLPGKLTLVATTVPRKGLRLGEAAPVDLAPGVAVVADVRLPGVLKDLFPAAPDNARLLFAVGTSATLRAGLDLGVRWPVVRPEHGLPSLASVTFTAVALRFELTGGVLSVGVGGAVELVPLDRAGQLQAALAGEGWLSVEATGAVGGELFVAGLWREPFRLRDVAVRDPAVELAVQVAPGPVVVPTTLGLNVDLLRGDQVLGGTLFYDKTPSPSGFCMAGTCAPLPPLVLGVRAPAVSTDDAIALLSDLNTAAQEVLSDAEVLRKLLPPAGERVPVPELPVDLALGRADLAFSTHTMTKWGRPLTAGLRVAIEAEVGAGAARRRVNVDGAVGPTGLTLAP